jgi:outer membrane biosynthesis protein TonB
MIKITIEVKDISEAVELLHKFDADHTKSVKADTPAADTETDKADTQVTDKDQVSEEKQAVEDKKPPRRKKRTTKKTASKETAETKKVEEKQDDTPSKDDVRKALADVGSAKGFRAASAVCQEFKAKGLKDLDEKYYAAVIKRCEEVTAE